VPSPLALTAWVPSGVTATDQTGRVCPARMTGSLPLSRSQTRTVRSLPPLMARSPSGVMATARTSPL
jgi:hypothetical protein